MDPGRISGDESLIGLLLAPKKRFGSDSRTIQQRDCLFADPEALNVYYYLLKY